MGAAILQKQEGFENQRLLVIPESVLSLCRNHPLIQSIYIADIGCFPTAKNHYRERPAGCASTIILCCVHGSGWIQAGEKKKISIAKGQIAIIPAGLPHIYGADEASPWSIYWLHVAGDQVRAFLGDTAWIYPPNQTDLERWFLLFEECWEHLTGGVSVPSMLYCSQVVRQMLAILHLHGTGSSASTKQNNYMERAILYMREHMDQKISLNELSSYTQVSKPHLIALFKRQTGYPPLEYFLRMKIQNACNDLDFSDSSVKEIAAKLGFSDPYYFSRQFSKVMSHSPTAYRNTNKG